MVMVQVVITTEWFVINMPLKISTADIYPECDVPKETFLLLHVYPSLLLILTALYGMSVFRIKRNYNEDRWVTCATVCIIPVLAAWAIIYYFAPVHLHDPTNAVCIVIIGEWERENSLHAIIDIGRLSEKIFRHTIMTELTHEIVIEANHDHCSFSTQIVKTNY